MRKYRASEFGESPYENGKMLGNTIISGKWVWITVAGERGDLHRFRVTYITPRGAIRRCFSHSSSSNDIKVAMARLDEVG